MIMSTTKIIAAMMNGTNITAADRDFIDGAKGFFERYIRNRAYYSLCEDAYERTEQQYQALMGKRRYRSYDSFRSAFSQFEQRNRAKH
jgi:hypothetical protein